MSEHARADRSRGEFARALRDGRAVVAGENDELRRESSEAQRPLAFAGVLLERDVEVRPAEPERAHGRAARVVSLANPRPGRRVEIERGLLDLHLRRGLVDPEGRRQDLVVQREHGLEEPGGSGRSLRVTELRLDGPERGPLAVFAAAGVEDLTQRVELREVARLRSGAVRLDEVDGLRPVACFLVAALKRLDLALPARRIDALGAAVRRAAATSDDRVDAIAVALGVGEALESEHADALAEHRAVGALRERPARAAHRQGGRLREAHERERIVGRVRAARDRRDPRRPGAACAPTSPRRRTSSRTPRRS